MTHPEMAATLSSQVKSVQFISRQTYSPNEDKTSRQIYSPKTGHQGKYTHQRQDIKANILIKNMTSRQIYSPKDRTSRQIYSPKDRTSRQIYSPKDRTSRQIYSPKDGTARQIYSPKEDREGGGR